MKIRRRISFTFILTLLTTASCGLRDNPEPVPDGSPADAVQAEEGTKAVAQFRYLELSFESLELLQGIYAMNDEWLYIMESPLSGMEGVDTYTHVDRIRISDGYEEKNYITSDWEIFEYGADAFLVDREGNCYLFWTPGYRAAEDVYALEKYGADGALLWRAEYTPEELLDMGGNLDKGAVTEDGRVLLYSSGTGAKVFAFGADGTLEDVYAPELEVLDGVVIEAGNKAYGYCVTGDEPLFMELGGGGSYACPIAPLEVYDGRGEGIFLRTGEGMWGYVPETGETQLLWGWEDEYVQINGDYIDLFFCSGGKYLLLCNERQIMVSTNHTRPVLTFASVTLEDAAEYPARQAVTLSVFYRSEPLDQMAKLYNRQGRRYRIEIVEDMNEELLKKKLVQGEGADLIDISNIYAEDLAALGAFEDLAPYYEASENIDREDILEPIRKAGTIGGMELGVMPSFQLDTLLAQEAYCAPEDWTIWKFLEMSRENKMFSEQDPGKIFHYCMGLRYGEHFVDMEKRESYFGGGEFRRVLEECSAVQHYRYTPAPNGVYPKFEDSDYLFTEVSIMSPWDIVSDDDKDYSAKLLGYPGWSGGEYRIHASGIFAINSASPNKEGAWDFLEYLLSEEFQDRVNWGFPARKDNFETWLTDLYMSPGWQEIYSYYLKEPAIPTEKDIARLREMVDSAVSDSWGGTTNPIWEIAEFEAAMYFAGDATLQDTVNKIQNRMQIYMDE